MHISHYENILFIEGDYSPANKLKQIACKLNSIFSPAQLKSLEDIKKKMANEANRNGANCITNFKYGQQTNWKSWFGLDDVSWYREGCLAILSKEEYQKLIIKQ